MTRPFFGYHIHSFTYPDAPPEGLFDRVVQLACAAERAGFGLLTVMDHFYQIPGLGPEEDPMLEAYTALGAIAARTESARIATLVSGVTYRNPALLAKQVTTLDVISKGRAMLGIGAAWNESEHRGYSFEFPPIGERMDRLEEACAIAKLMFTQERSTFEGRYYRIQEALNSPRPIQPGGPPLLIGGGGERRTLRVVAKYGDMAHWFPAPLEILQHKKDVLARHCADVGRDPSTITLTLGAPFVIVSHERDGAAALARLSAERQPPLGAKTPEQAAEALRPFLDLGFTGFTFGLVSLPTPEDLAVAGEFIRLVA